MKKVAAIMMGIIFVGATVMVLNSVAIAGPVLQADFNNKTSVVGNQGAKIPAGDLKPVNPGGGGGKPNAGGPPGGNPGVGKPGPGHPGFHPGPHGVHWHHRPAVVWGASYAVPDDGCYMVKRCYTNEFGRRRCRWVQVCD